MHLTRFAFAIVALAMIALAGSARAISNGQLDDFQDGTVQNWANGGGAPPVLNIATGGPGGAGDRFMQIAADGSGAGRFLTVFNRSQWLGDYIAAGVTAIEMDLRNQSTVNLNIRLAFRTDTSFGASGYLTASLFLPANTNTWQHNVFSITAGTLIAVDGPAPFNTFFANGFGEMRIINEAGSLNLTGDVVTAQLGIDNIHAIPEPSSILLMAAGLMGLRDFRRRTQS